MNIKQISYIQLQERVITNMEVMFVYIYNKRIEGNVQVLTSHFVMLDKIVAPDKACN